MDFNHLYSAHQLQLVKAARAPNARFRRAHVAAAAHLAGRIGRAQRALGAAAAPGWETLAAPAWDSLALPGCPSQGYAA